MLYQNRVVPKPCKDSQLASTAQMCGSEKRGGRRVDRSLKCKISSQKIEGLGVGGAT